MAKLTPWDEFRDAVEGRAGARPMAVVDDLPALAAGPTVQKPVPNPALLSALLRGGAPIPPDVRGWLADLFDPEGDGLMRVKGLVKRGDGPMPGPVLKHSAAVEAFRAAFEDGELRKNARDDAAKAFGITRSTMESAITAQEAAEEEHARAARED